MRYPVRSTVGLAIVVLTAACGSVVHEGTDLGSGTYLQVLDAGRVVAERDLSGTGFRPCTAVAVQMVRSTPALKGRIRCAPAPTDASLPFSFVAHSHRGESDEVMRTPAFVTRTATAQLCTTMRDVTSRQEKTVIVRQSCGA